MARWAQGLALAALGASVIAAGIALARGPDMNLPGSPGMGPAGGWSGSPEAASPWRYSRAYAPQDARAYAPEDDGEARPAHRRHASTGKRGVRVSGVAVCVRLCDGSFFPAASVGAGDAGCAAQCPEAPTELYSMTSDRIEDAYSARTGTPYSKLPVAKRFEASHEATCSCHREAIVSHEKELQRDTTLRKGDVVMTDEGFRVFEGSGWGPTTAQDFVPVAKAGVSKAETEQLAAMEHASAGPTLVSAPRLMASKGKGNVTVDDGPR